MKTYIPAARDFSTRRKRRAAVNRIVGQLQNIVAAEKNYRDSIPLTHHGAVLQYDTADWYICLLCEAVETLRSLY
jgi:hypothetical protein